MPVLTIDIAFDTNTNNKQEQVMQVQWSNPIETKVDVEQVAGKAVTQTAMVTWFGQVVKPPERLMFVTMNASVSAEIQYLSAMAELDYDEIKAEGVELALVGAEVGNY